MESPARQIGLVPPPDRRQSETALAVARGTARLLRALGFACVSELPLPSGRRADLVSLNERGEIWIIACGTVGLLAAYHFAAGRQEAVEGCPR